MPQLHYLSLVTFFIAATAALAESSRRLSAGKLLPSRQLVDTSSDLDITSTNAFTEKLTLVQISGEVESVRNFELQLPDGVELDVIEFIQYSSNINVLHPENNDNILVAASTSGQKANITVSNTFDLLVGQTNYSLAAKRRDTGISLYSWTIFYTISGVSFYRTFPSGEKELVSGMENQFAVSYEDVMQPHLAPENEMQVLIQYPDGSTSLDSKSNVIPQGDNLKMTFTEHRAQFRHNATQCKISRIGFYSPDTGLMLPPGCGYGFYRSESGDLRFGILYEPYRAGTIHFEITWDGLVEHDTELFDDGFTNELYVSILGLPPVVVSKVEDEHFVYRQEGGQTITINFFNEDLQPSRMMEFLVDGGTAPFKELPGSYQNFGYPNYSQSITFVTEPGSGEQQPWEMLYYVAEDSGNEAYSVAQVMPWIHYRFKYDANAIVIKSISPKFGSKNGGETVVLTGYFVGFDPAVDAVYFNGQPIIATYYTQVRDAEIRFKLPAQAELGSSYDYQVIVRVGRALSNAVGFKYLVSEAKIQFFHTGTTEDGSGDSLTAGDCTPIQLSVIVSPYTDQIVSFEWSIYYYSDDGRRGARVTTVFDEETYNVSTVNIDPARLEVGEEYVVVVKVTLLGTIAEGSVKLLRQNAITIGAFIHDPSKRSIASPESPLRLSAVVEPPGECFDGVYGLVFEWNAFGKTQLFSSRNATGVISNDELKMTPARLGWEYLVPQSDLKYGDHRVTFTVFVESKPHVRGIATAMVTIVPSALQAIIRSGESRLRINSNTNLHMFGTSSYDPDEKYQSLTSIEKLSFEWTCRQTSGSDFEDYDSCQGGFLPEGPFVEEFTVPSAVIDEMLNNVTALEYQLVVRKGNRTSPPAFVVVDIDPVRSQQPFMTGYSVEIQDIDGNPQDLHDVKYYEPVIVAVDVPSLVVSWSYQVVDPPRRTLLTSGNLIQGPAFYSPDVTNINGNRKPLGIEAFKLDPFTNYTFKLTFSGSAEFEDTEVFVSFKTSQSPALIFPEPYMMTGSIQTRFMAAAGLPQDDSMFVYYFLLQDSNGMEYCIGGCTGQKVTYFRVGRIGEYKLSVLLYDSQGKALLARKTLDSPIVVKAAKRNVSLYAELDTLFANGDDNSWTQLAFDLATELVNPLHTAGRQISDRKEALDGNENITILQNNDTYAFPRVNIGDVEMSVLADGLRKIFCASRPSAGHSALGVEVATLLSKMATVPHKSIYDLMATVECCVNLSPKGTSTSYTLEQLISNLETHADSSGQVAGTRRRLLQTTGDTPQNIMADIICWSGKMVTATSTSAKSEGFTANVMKGQYSVAVVANEAQLPSILLNGQIRNGIRTSFGEDEMMFYASGECASTLFASTGDKRRFLAVQALPNFVIEGNFQEEPPGRNLAKMLYRIQLFAENVNGKLTDVIVEERQDIDPCYCYKFPIILHKDKLNEGIGNIPTMYALKDEKPFGEEAKGKGEFFNYDIDGHGIVSYNIKEGWVITCSRTIGFVGPTIGSTRSQNTLGNGAQLMGLGAIGFVAMLVAALIFILVAIVATWAIAAKSMEAGEAQPEALQAHELYVERDIYGRDTIIDRRKGRGTAEKGGPSS